MLQKSPAPKALCRSTFNRRKQLEKQQQMKMNKNKNKNKNKKNNNEDTEDSGGESGDDKCMV